MGGMVVLSFWGSRVVCSCLVGVVVSVAPSRAQWEDLSEEAVTVTSIACDGEDLS